ncbi:MAG: hypothetical protein ACYTFX_12255 [Planctomycetota bacterium]|jgi:hypothetical protein
MQNKDIANKTAHNFLIGFLIICAMTKEAASPIDQMTTTSIRKVKINRQIRINPEASILPIILKKPIGLLTRIAAGEGR